MQGRERYFAGLLISLALLVVLFAKTQIFNAAHSPIPTASFSKSALPQDVLTKPQTEGLGKANALFPIDLNKADAERISLLPGIGKKTAQRIIEKRQELGGFSSIDDLKTVPGVKEGRLKKIRPLVIVTRGE